MPNDFSRDMISGNDLFTAPEEALQRASRAQPRVTGRYDAQPEGGERMVEKGTAFSQALQRVERRRSIVRGAMALALIGRLLVDLELPTLVRTPLGLLDAVPHIGIALLAYLVVLWFLAARTRDRFGFGMALGIGVLHGTYALAGALTQRPLLLPQLWPTAAVAIAHLLMAGAAIHASRAYPPHDSKRPWVVGFVTALVFLAAPWVAPW